MSPLAIVSAMHEELHALLALLEPPSPEVPISLGRSTRVYTAPHGNRGRMKEVLKWLWRAIRGVFLAMAALIIAIEEWGWRPLTAMAARCAKWPPIGRLEDRIRHAPRHVALLLFLAPAVLLFPVKLLALWLIHLGRTKLGVVVILAAKALGTAFVGRLFILTEAQLTTFPWFAGALSWWRATKLRVRAALDRSLPMRAMWRLKRLISLSVKRFIRSTRNVG